MGLVSLEQPFESITTLEQNSELEYEAGGSLTGQMLIGSNPSIRKTITFLWK